MKAQEPRQFRLHARDMARKLRPFTGGGAMNRSPFFPLLLSLFVLGLGGSFDCRGSDAPASATSGQADTTDRQYLREAVRAAATEIEASRLALGRSTNQAVKRYAQDLIVDHEKLTQALRALAAARDVILPPAPAAGEDARIAELKPL